jgi:hypothetical protein
MTQPSMVQILNGQFHSYSYSYRPDVPNLNHLKTEQPDVQILDISRFWGFGFRTRTVYERSKEQDGFETCLQYCATWFVLGKNGKWLKFNFKVTATICLTALRLSKPFT